MESEYQPPSSLPSNTNESGRSSSTDQVTVQMTLNSNGSQANQTITFDSNESVPESSTDQPTESGTKITIKCQRTDNILSNSTESELSSPADEAADNLPEDSNETVISSFDDPLVVLITVKKNINESGFSSSDDQPTDPLLSDSNESDQEYDPNPNVLRYIVL
jgi:hypothetical protein